MTSTISRSWPEITRPLLERSPRAGLGELWAFMSDTLHLDTVMIVAAEVPALIPGGDDRETQLRVVGADVAIAYQRHRAGLLRTETWHIVGKDGVTAVPAPDWGTSHMLRAICDRMDDSDFRPSEAGPLY